MYCRLSIWTDFISSATSATTWMDAKPVMRWVDEELTDECGYMDYVDEYPENNTLGYESCATGLKMTCSYLPNLG